MAGRRSSPFAHHEIAVATAEAGKHILVEKPLATTVVEAESIVAAWKCSVLPRVRANVRLSGESLRVAATLRRLCAVYSGPRCRRSNDGHSG
jgi:hypothetical protein